MPQLHDYEDLDLEFSDGGLMIYINYEDHVYVHFFDKLALLSLP